MVSRGGFVNRGRLVGWVLSLALIFNLSQEAGVAVHSVGNPLQSTVWKLDVIGSLSVVAITSFIVAEVVAGVVVLHGPVEVVLGRTHWFRSIVGRSWRIVGGSWRAVSGWWRAISRTLLC